MDEIDRAIINTLQGGLPVCERPYLAAAQALGVDEATLLTRLQAMLASGLLTRIGPLYQIEKMGGAFTLAALHAGAQDFEHVAQAVNALPEVAHNYQRDHALNMWFVLATESPEQIADVIRKIEQDTGCEVFNFPKSREFFVELKLQA
ncbi:Lrp/AsnC family transcriptional regulator [Rhodoferax sp.]|uniref:Lrp/AsnC family transcriptional regulator n=1 Tax=Rhodoferax sp. TaxID=50421 RepID=UPI0027445C57|nr:AsnC family transcriptional regulator [Rhodoferax sp.]